MSSSELNLFNLYYVELWSISCSATNLSQSTEYNESYTCPLEMRWTHKPEHQERRAPYVSVLPRVRHMGSQISDVNAVNDSSAPPRDPSRIRVACEIGDRVLDLYLISLQTGSQLPDCLEVKHCRPRTGTHRSLALGAVSTQTQTPFFNGDILWFFCGSL